MNEVSASILTMCTMVCLISFSGFMCAQLREEKMNIIPRILNSIFTFSLKPFEGIKNKMYIMFYFMIPACLFRFISLLQQFRIGKIYLKVDLSFWSEFALWICTPIFVIWIVSYINKNK